MKNLNTQKIIFTIIILIGANFSLSSQNQTILDTTNTFIRSKIHYSDTFGMIFWKCDSLTEGTLFLNKVECGLQNEDSMHLRNNWLDSISNKQTNVYCQYYKNIRVDNSDYTEIFDNHGVYLTTGWIVEGLNLNNNPSLNESQALDVVLNYLEAEKYAWEDSLSIDSCYFDTAYTPSDTICMEVEFYPVGELIYYNKLNDKNPNNYVLAWLFNSVYAINPYSDKKWYIDANTGDIIDSVSNLNENSASHWYYGNVPIDTRWYGGIRNKYTLDANDGSKNIATRLFGTANEMAIMDKETNWKYSEMPKSSNSTWGTNSRDETSTHYVVTSAWDCFASSFGHHGFSNNYNSDWLRVGVYLNGRTGALLGSSRVVKKFNGDIRYRIEHIGFGKIDGQLTCTYDHAGHEFAHIVNHHSKKLKFNDLTEASSINEGFCDIFGFMTERFAKGTGWDWVVGADIQTSKVRSMFSPLTTPYRSVFAPGNLNYPEFYPAIYKGANWHSGSILEPHINSTVLSRCFNLLSVGGNQNSVTVNGIGVDKAGQIAFFTFRNLVDESETYPQLREHMIAAATTLFGNCSPEVFETCKAWKACGIGDLCPCSPGGNDIGNWNDECRNLSERPSKNTVSINSQQYEVKSIKVYPNPTNDFVLISFSEILYDSRSNISISLSSMDGKIQFEKNYDISNKDNIEIDIRNLSPGIYQVIVNTRNIIYSYKILKL
jgi:bacillolysin